MAKHVMYKRPVKATLHRFKNGKHSTEVVWVRFYNSITACLSKGVALAVQTGEPGDVLELSSSNHGYAIATLKVKLGSKGLTTMDIEFHISVKGNV